MCMLHGVVQNLKRMLNYQSMVKLLKKSYEKFPLNLVYFCLKKFYWVQVFSYNLQNFNCFTKNKINFHNRKNLQQIKNNFITEKVLSKQFNKKDFAMMQCTVNGAQLLVS